MDLCLAAVAVEVVCGLVVQAHRVYLAKDFQAAARLHLQAVAVAVALAPQVIMVVPAQVVLLEAQVALGYHILSQEQVLLMQVAVVAVVDHQVVAAAHQAVVELVEYPQVALWQEQ
jgi:hypothetical protein